MRERWGEDVRTGHRWQELDAGCRPRAGKEAPNLTTATMEITIMMTVIRVMIKTLKIVITMLIIIIYIIISDNTINDNHNHNIKNENNNRIRYSPYKGTIRVLHTFLGMCSYYHRFY